MNHLETEEAYTSTYSEQVELQKRTAIVDEIHKNIFVEAGAGAGKTSLIVNRVIHQIKKGIRPEELVVITFTNKAAEELFERITEGLVNEEQSEACEEIKNRCTYAIEHIEQMNISTIHSFCFQLLQEKCFEGYLPLDVSVLENEDAEKRKNNFLEQWYSQLLTQDILQMREVLSEIGYWDVKKALQKVFGEICEKPSDVHIVTYDDAKIAQMKSELNQKKLEAEQLKQQVYAELKSFVDFLAGEINTQEHTNRSTVEIMNISEDYIMANYRTLFQEILQGNLKPNSSVKKLYENANTQVCKKAKADITTSCRNWLSANLEGKSTYKDWQTAEEEMKDFAKAYVYFVFIKYADKAKTKYTESLTGQELSNDELLQKADLLIKNSENARLYFANKYKCIYVDEFQDTDHIQANLVWNLALDEAKEQLRPGALFVVGDPKQAIYRFRGGEPAVYYHIKQKMAKIAKEDPDRVLVYELDDNYRSNREMIGWINQVFQPAFGDGTITYRDMQCKIPKDALKDGEEGLEALEGVYLTLQEPKEKRDKMIPEEAEKLANFIQNIVQGDYGIYETIRMEGQKVVRRLRKVQYRDFLILCRGKKDMKKYLPILEKKQIPVEMSGEIVLDENKVLRNFIKLFQYLMCPTDRKAYQGAVHVVCHSSAASAGEIAGVRLTKIRNDVREMSSRAVVQYLVNHPEYLLPWGEDISKAQLKSLQSKLRMMTESVLSMTKSDPTLMTQAFLNYVEIPQERELSLKEDSNAVRFMNVHKVKGLEGNIVILMNRKQMPSGVTNYQELKQDHTYDYYGCFTLPSKSYAGYSIDPYGLMQYREKGIRSTKEETEEFTRLEYVAATRAREVLVVFKELGKEPCFFEKYPIDSSRSLDFLQSENSVNQETTNSSNVKDFKTTKGEREVWDNKPTDAEEQEMFQKTYVNLSPSMLEGILQKPEENSEIEEVKERRPKGNVFGTTMHRSFELLVQRYCKEHFKGNLKECEALLQVCVCQAIMENYEDLLAEGIQRYVTKEEKPEIYPEAVKNYLFGNMAKFLQSEKIQKYFEEAKEIYTELPFSYYTSRESDGELFADIEEHLQKHRIEIEQNQPVWVNGTADLVILSKDGSIKVIDYKSDTKREEKQLFEERLEAKYQGQMLLYRHSMSKIFKVPTEKINVELYHLYQE